MELSQLCTGAPVLVDNPKSMLVGGLGCLSEALPPLQWPPGGLRVENFGWPRSPVLARRGARSSDRDGEDLVSEFGPLEHVLALA